MELAYHQEFEDRTTYKYDLTGTSQIMFVELKYLLNWDWHASSKSATTK